MTSKNTIKQNFDRFFDIPRTVTLPRYGISKLYSLVDREFKRTLRSELTARNTRSIEERSAVSRELLELIDWPRSPEVGPMARSIRSIITLKGFPRPRFSSKRVGASASSLSFALVAFLVVVAREREGRRDK